jgi:hypothetical protein
MTIPPRGGVLTDKDSVVSSAELAWLARTPADCRTGDLVEADAPCRDPLSMQLGFDRVAVLVTGLGDHDDIDRTRGLGG